MEQGHALCTVRTLRAERATLRLQQLQAAATAARDVVLALEVARDTLDAQLETWRTRLWQVEQAERELRAVVDEGRDPDQAAQAEVELLRQLRGPALLLEARFETQLQHENGAAWRGVLPQTGAGRSLAIPLVLHMHSEGSIVLQVGSRGEENRTSSRSQGM